MLVSLLLFAIVLTLTRARDLAQRITDITQSKQAEAQIESARQLLDAVLNASPSPLWVKDDAGAWLLINNAAAKLLGGPRESFLGRSAHDVYCPELADKATRQDREALESEAVQSVEGEILSINGERRWGIKRKRAVALPDGRRIVIASVMDLTQQRKAQLELEKSRRFLEAVIDAMPQGVFVKDTDPALGARQRGSVPQPRGRTQCPGGQDAGGGAGTRGRGRGSCPG